MAAHYLGQPFDVHLKIARLTKLNAPAKLELKLEGELAGLADWWESFASAGPEEREKMLIADAAPKKRSSPTSRAAFAKAPGATSSSNTTVNW